MANFHLTMKIIGRSKGESVIAASAYLNGAAMKNEETGKYSYYTSKKEVVYRQLMMCKNTPPEWEEVPRESIERFKDSVRYKRAESKEEAVEQFKSIWRKQKLWNEVLKVENKSDSQLGRSMEFSLPKEWSREEQIEYATEYIQKNFVDRGMCADWAIHDKGDGNPHVHLILTVRPFKEDHTWGNKEVKDWEFVRDASGSIVIDLSHPDWWQDKKNPERCGIRIPVLDENGNQKLDSRNRKQWKRVLTDATGWNNPKNCELWRSEWAKLCNEHLPQEQQLDHRSYARQGRLEIPTIHEGTDGRQIEKKYLEGKEQNGSWLVAENQEIKKKNGILHSICQSFEKLSGKLKEWKEQLNDFRRKREGNFHTGRSDQPVRGAAGTSQRDVWGSVEHGSATRKTGGRVSELVRIGIEAKRRESGIIETERGIAEIKQAVKGEEINERMERLMSRRTDRVSVESGGEAAGRTGGEREKRPSARRKLEQYQREIERQNQRTKQRKSIDRGPSL